LFGRDSGGLPGDEFYAGGALGPDGGEAEGDRAVLAAGRDLTQLVQSWQEIGAPPIVLGGVVNQQPSTHPWSEPLPPKYTKDTTILISKEWNPIESGGMDDQPIWIQAGK